MSYQNYEECELQTCSINDCNVPPSSLTMPAELSFGSLKTTIIAEKNHILGYSHSFCLDCDIKVVSKSTIVKAPSPHLTIQVTQNPLDCKTKISSKQMFQPDLVKFDKNSSPFEVISSSANSFFENSAPVDCPFTDC